MGAMGAATSWPGMRRGEQMGRVLRLLAPAVLGAVLGSAGVYYTMWQFWAALACLYAVYIGFLIDK